MPTLISRRTLAIESGALCVTIGERTGDFFNNNLKLTIMQINHDNFLFKRIRSIIPFGLVYRIRNLIPIAFVFILLFDACKKTENLSPRNLNSPLVLTASD